MERRKFIKSSVLGTSLAATGFSASALGRKAVDKEIYELREYSLQFRGREKDISNYFEKALIPALNKYGVGNVGVFKETSGAEPVKIYLLIPFKTPSNYFEILSKVNADEAYKAASQTYDSIGVESNVFSRYESSLMLAFDGMPQMKINAKGSRIFELRTYEGYSEDAVRRKIEMFNKGEIDIFLKTGLTPVFFGEVTVGKKLPCLTYMLTFKDMEEREANWKKFGSHPDWKIISKDPKYANTVSHITKMLLQPLPISQI